jgi:hypothetical protein
MSDVAPVAPNTPTTKPPAKSGSGLGKKLGPLPIWGWAIVIIVGYFLYKFLKDRSAASSATGLAAAGTGAAVNEAGDSGGGNNVSTPTSDETVTDWIDAAQTALGNLGYDSGSVNQAFQDYLAGNPLSSSEVAIIDSATKLVGGAPADLGTPQVASTGGTGATGTSSGGGTTAPPTQPNTASPGLLSGISTGNVAATLAAILGSKDTGGGSQAASAAGPDGSVSLADFERLLTDNGLSQAEASVTASEVYNQQSASGGIVSIPGYQTTNVTSEPTAAGAVA